MVTYFSLLDRIFFRYSLRTSLCSKSSGGATLDSGGNVIFLNEASIDCESKSIQIFGCTYRAAFMNVLMDDMLRKSLRGVILDEGNGFFGLDNSFLQCFQIFFSLR